jgi:hypothetical protein
MFRWEGRATPEPAEAEPARAPVDMARATARWPSPSGPPSARPPGPACGRCKGPAPAGRELCVPCEWLAGMRVDLAEVGWRTIARPELSIAA